MKVIWSIVPEIWSVTDRIFCHFGLFFALPCPPNNSKNQNFKKMKKKQKKNTWRYYHFTQVYHKWQSHDVWFLRYQTWRTEFCVILDHFLPFTPIPRKIKILKTWKQDLEISSFYTNVPKIMMICYTVPEIWRITDLIVIFHFGIFFALLPPNSPQNQNLKKMKKTPGDIIILLTFTKNYDQTMYGCWDMVRNRRTDKRKKWKK